MPNEEIAPSSTPIADEMRRRFLDAKLQQAAFSGSGIELSASGIDGFITEQELADKLALSLATVRRWRRRGYGPKSVRIGRRDYYREDAVERFASDQLAKAEREIEAPRRGRRRA
jgi:predicted DNA-binding transcriptional regulator AlpA